MKKGLEIKAPKFFQKHPIAKDIASLVVFVALVVVGTLLLNAYVFRSYNVIGVSMENTLHGNDRIIVNRVPVTIAHFVNVMWAHHRKRGDNTTTHPAVSA